MWSTSPRVPFAARTEMHLRSECSTKYHEGMIAARPAWIWPRAAYVHIPFCAHHCGYCDFAVAVGQDDRIDAYLDALEIELAGLGEPQPIETLFFGGGTPTYLPHRPLERLLNLVQRWLPLAPPPLVNEFSVEANPSYLDVDKVELLRSAGVNRLSLGVQSFEPALLGVLERDHRPDDVPRVLEFIRPRIGNFSVDLIFGVPGQTLAQWRRDLDRALALDPKHIATYGLTYEKGTRLWKQREHGQVVAHDEETEYQSYMQAMTTLPESRLRAVRDFQFRPVRLSLPAQRGLLGQSRLLRLWRRRRPVCQRHPRTEHARCPHLYCTLASGPSADVPVRMFAAARTGRRDDRRAITALGRDQPGRIWSADRLRAGRAGWTEDCGVGRTGDVER